MFYWIRNAVTLAVVASVGTGLASDSCELFNGRDLTGWYKFLKGRGKDNDPKGVITVTNGVIRITGEEFGCLTTEEDFSDYRLTVEYRFLGTRFEAKKDKALDSGILFHSVGKDGGFAGIWMASHEYNLIIGASGDFWTVHPKGSGMYLKAETSKRKLGAHRIWEKGGEEVTISGNDRICRCDIDPTWTDTPAAPLAANENPVGDWNTAVLECRGDSVDCYFNGKHVNHATHVSPSHGKIQLQSEACGVEFRRVTLERFYRVPACDHTEVKKVIDFAPPASSSR